MTSLPSSKTTRNLAFYTFSPDSGSIVGHFEVESADGNKVFDIHPVSPVQALELAQKLTDYAVRAMQQTGMK